MLHISKIYGVIGKHQKVGIFYKYSIKKNIYTDLPRNLQFKCLYCKFKYERSKYLSNNNYDK